MRQIHDRMPVIYDRETPAMAWRTVRWFGEISFRCAEALAFRADGSS
jgi:hypothetical protein